MVEHRYAGSLFAKEMDRIVFALFYETLYPENAKNGFTDDQTTSDGATEVTEQEVTDALKVLKRHRTGADDGLVAEMLQTGHEGLHRSLAAFFTELLQGRLAYPAKWKQAKLAVIYKSGDQHNVKNYRPITIIPVMAKLFSTVLYARIAPLIEDRLAEEQYGLERAAAATMPSMS